MGIWHRITKKTENIWDNILWWKQSKKWKRDDCVVLFGAWFGERYADTSRYLYQFLSDNKEKYGLTRVVWATRSEVVRTEITNLGYEAYLLDSEESIRYHQIAGTHIICNMADTGDLYSGDLMGQYSYGARKVNLWHGVMPMKGVASASNEYKAKKKASPIRCRIQEFLIGQSKIYRSFVNTHGGWGDCYYLSVTPAGTDILRQFFMLPQNHFIETGNPRVCGQVSYTDREKQFVEILKDYNKVILYLPTFRDPNSSFDYSHVAEPTQPFLRKENALWVQKAHSAASSATYSYQKEGNIVYLSSDFDINSIMQDITLLVTDFSSVAADAMYYYKPIIYYMPDYEEYLSKDRGFVIDPETVMMGSKAFNLDELQEKMGGLLNSTFLPDKKYEDTRFRFWGPDKTMDEIWIDIARTIKL
ncbi:MAG: CDP-glycerol glycerophosphotransferase family protein [Christensenellaceae bacterium]